MPSRCFRDSLLPAEVTVQDVVDLLHGGLRVLLQEGVQLHHHARTGGKEIKRNILEKLDEKDLRKNANSDSETCKIHTEFLHLQPIQVGLGGSLAEGGKSHQKRLDRRICFF